MGRLRNFAYSPDNQLISEVLDRFDIKNTNARDDRNLALLKFEIITPDSFMWRILYLGNIYYLYAEDYIPNLGHVKNMFNSYTAIQKWKLIKTKTKIEFHKATPVTTATTNKMPEDSEDITNYAVDSDPDFVFLCQSDEKTEDALFSEATPNGFNIIA